MLKSNKCGQVSETLTWIVATVIIVVVLSASVFLSSLIGENKTFHITEKVDLLAKKSMTSYLLTKDIGGAPVYDQINEDNKLNEFAGNLALDIFLEIYGRDYNWQNFLGIRDEGSSTAYRNDYFSSPSIVVGNAALSSNLAVFYLINIGNNKLAQLVLWKTN